MTRDRLMGLLLCALSVVLILSAMQIRRVIPIGIGPGAFPVVLASALGILGLVLIIRSQPAFNPALTLPAGRTLAALAIYGGVAAFALLAFESLGFIVTGAITLIVVGRMLGAGWRALVTTAIVAPVTMHLIFERVFAVPLPAGIVSGILP